jgi:hypothetical protein
VRAVGGRGVHATQDAASRLLSAARSFGSGSARHDATSSHRRRRSPVERNAPLSRW